MKYYLYWFLELIFRNWYPKYKEIVSNDFSFLEEKYLHELLLHSYKNVPYYKEIFDRIALVKNNRLDLENFYKIPVINKNIIKNNFSLFLSKDISRRRWYKNSSGGSTGIPQTFIQDDNYKNWMLASEFFYFKKIIKIDPFKAKKVLLWGSERDIFRQKKSLSSKLAAFLRKEIFLNTFKITKKDFLKYVEIINKEKPEYIKGYAGSLYQLAKIVKENNLKIHHPKFIYSSAETLRPFMRDLIEEIFKCKVYDYYGSREVGAIAGECPKGKMHIFNFNNFVEVIDDNGNRVKTGEMGKVIVTNLHNYSMPLIRYEIGDTAVLGEKCDCDIKTPVLEKITGRVTDHFKNKNGDLIHGEYFTHLFYFKEWIKAFQVVQIDFNKIVIYFVANKENEQDMIDIENKIKLVMGNDCLIEWKKVNNIEPTSQGKYLFTISFVNK